MRHSALCAFLLAAAACGGGGPTDNDGDGFDGFTARIDGAVWSAEVAPSAVNNEPGRYFISAVRNTGLNYSMTFILDNITGPGTYPLGVHGSMFGGHAFLVQPGGNSWTNPFDGNAGEIVITTLTATRMVGTFEFVAEADAGTATGTRTVTQGEFDIAVTQTGGVAAANMGSSFTADVGTPFYVAQVAQQLVSDNLIILAQGGTGQITISLTGMTGSNVYNLSTSVPIRSILLGQTAGGWTSATTGGSGSVNLTVTADRFSGTFSATVIGTGGGAIGPRMISGTFSIGRAAP